MVSAGDGDAFSPAVSGPAYGLSRLGAAADYSRDVLAALAAQGVAVEQYHPEYAPGQFELSVAAESPVHAADTSVLVRQTIRSVGQRHGFRTSYSPKVDTAGVGNGGHVHLSLWREGRNLMAGGTSTYGLTDEAAAFTGGVLAHLPALLAIGAPGVASYLRLVPQHWAGAYRCWGLENREAALRMVTGSTGSEDWAANLEVKCVDLQANPYLLLAGLLAGAPTASTGAPHCPTRSRSTPRRWATRRLPPVGSTGCPAASASRSPPSAATAPSGPRSEHRSSTRSSRSASRRSSCSRAPRPSRLPTPPAGRTEEAKLACALSVGADMLLE